MPARALIHMPSSAKPGEVIEIRALIAHPMETGFRAGNTGGVLPRDIIRSFVCKYNGVQVFAAELHPAMSANPYIAFFTRASRSCDCSQGCRSGRMRSPRSSTRPRPRAASGQRGASPICHLPSVTSWSGLSPPSLTIRPASTATSTPFTTSSPASSTASPRAL